MSMLSGWTPRLDGRRLPLGRHVLGISAILSSPLTTRTSPVGALTIYSRSASSFDVNAQETAAAFAQKASAILGDARIDVNKVRKEIRFKEPVRNREVPSTVRNSSPLVGSMTDPPLDVLDVYREEAGLSHRELWLRYFELGGMSTGADVESILRGVLIPSSHDHDVIALALNERFAELGVDYPVPYVTPYW